MTHSGTPKGRIKGRLNDASGRSVSEAGRRRYEGAHRDHSLSRPGQKCKLPSNFASPSTITSEWTSFSDVQTARVSRRQNDVLYQILVALKWRSLEYRIQGRSNNVIGDVKMTSFGGRQNGGKEAKCKDILYFFTWPMSGRS